MPADRIEAIHTKLDRIIDDIGTLQQIVTGEGEPGKGLVVRLDRLEQTQKSRAKWVTTAVVTGIGALTTAIIDRLLHRS